VARSPAGAVALVSSLRRRLGDRFLAATDVVAGVCLIGFAGALGNRSTQ
jgi:hypothetical protein